MVYITSLCVALGISFLACAVWASITILNLEERLKDLTQERDWWKTRHTDMKSEIHSLFQRNKDL